MARELIDGLLVQHVSLSEAAAEMIRETASGSHGIGYWAEWHLKRPNVIREHVDATGKPGRWITLTRKRLSDGCRRALNAGVDLSGDRFDGPTADVVVQYAALGEERYG